MDRGGMDEVELVEDDWVESGSAVVSGSAPATPPGPPMALPWRPLLRRWWPVPLALTAVLVLTDLGTGSAQERDFVLAQRVAGVVAPIGPRVERTTLDLNALWTLMPQDVEDGISIAVSWDDNAGQYITGTALDTGTELWRTAFPISGDAASSFVNSDCWIDSGDAVCWSALSQWDTTGDVTLSGSNLVRLDVHTGAIRAEQPLAAETAATGEDGLLVTASRTGHELTVTAADSDGSSRWTTTVDVENTIGMTGTDRVSVALDDGLVSVTAPEGAWALSLADGRLLADGQAVWAARTGGFVVLRDGHLWLPSAEGDPRDIGTGEPLALQVDDGSVPDLQFVLSPFTSQLHAVDARTGDAAWSIPAPGGQLAPPLLIRDTLVTATTDSLSAVDARTGEDRWRVDLRTWTSWWPQPFTDGRQVLILIREDDGPVLASFDLHTGERLWSESVPSDTQQLISTERVLYLYRESAVDALS